ncbi:MAG: hypothetical protein QOE45_573 [Frankiaceae bacterium]|jgi:hypothetical protein|nr:hypothetical protein [Frankiaceae bacterium]
MRMLARLAIPFVLVVAPVVTATSASAEIIDNCKNKDVVVRVRPYVCVGANYPSATR